MNVLTKLVRQPNLVIGVVTSGLGLLVLFGIDLTEDQTAGIIVFLGAVFALAAYLVTPSSEVVAKVSNGTVVAGNASSVPTGNVLPLHGKNMPMPTTVEVPVQDRLVS